MNESAATNAINPSNAINPRFVWQPLLSPRIVNRFPVVANNTTNTMGTEWI